MGLSDVLSSIAFFLQFFFCWLGRALKVIYFRSSSFFKFFYLSFIRFDKTTIRRAVDDGASQDTKLHDVYSQKKV